MRTEVFNVTYGSQTWTFTKENVYKVVKTERAVEQQMLHIRFIDKKHMDKEQYVNDIPHKKPILSGKFPAIHYERRTIDGITKSYTGDIGSTNEQEESHK